MLTSAPLHHERYADDFIVLVSGEKNAEDMIRQRETRRDDFFTR
jgi:hypothetical protein